MEFTDITAGLYGFLIFAAIYIIFKMFIRLFQRKK
jgi:hypothetical protein